ncbi:CapA family protein [uncultured Jatrophihabitans sp.]|uniref:CapA family protein n=1 Tax=uncultured Jatrophihabitans sp. TaxID=1610747 RepID=UPI0035CC991A
MPSAYRLVVTGDVIMNSRVSVCREPEVVAALDIVRGADVAHAHLEIPLHDFGGADVFGAAEGALSWMRGPTYVAQELRTLGVDLVSTASNHSLDYSYGGLRSTLAALDAAGLAHAGSGHDLAAARAPAFADTEVGRVALVSATASFPPFARAGATRTDAAGRPGVNPQRYVHLVDRATADSITNVAGKLGLWVVGEGDEFVVHPPGLHNSIRRFRTVEGMTHPDTACDAVDLAGNLNAIRYAAAVADLVIAHLHVQEWDGHDGRMSSTPAFAHEFARKAADAGAAIVLVQGSHAPMRGIEVRDGVPILYDPGPLFRLGRRETQPQDFYDRWGNPEHLRSFDANLLDAYGARDTALGGERSGKRVLSPLEGNAHEPGFVLPDCEVDSASHRVTRLRLHPMSWSATTRGSGGFPIRLSGDRSDDVFERLAQLSAPYGTRLTFSNGVGEVAI